MIDPVARAARVREAGAPATSVCCCSTWCSGGARTLIRPARWPGDPRGAAGRSARRALAAVVASVVGTEADPQRLSGQVDQLRAAGVEILPSNAEAARFAALAVRPDLASSLLGAR